MKDDSQLNSPKARVIRPVRSKSTRTASRKKPVPRSIDRRPNPFGGGWEDFVNSVRAAIQISINQTVTPFDQPTSVLKRMVYEFVIKHRGKTQAALVETAIHKFRIDQEKQKRMEDQKLLRTPRKSFKTDSYYWILAGLSSAVHVGDFTIRKSDVTRFSKQLKYARRHRVPPEYLIGFLYQCGTISEVCRKADDPDHREEWFVAAGESKTDKAQ